MVTITSQALSVIRRVTGHPRLEPTSGLRVARTEPADEPLQVGAVNGPQPGDEVIERDGARLFLGPDAARTVRDGRLDATTDEAGRVTFILQHQ